MKTHILKLFCFLIWLAAIDCSSDQGLNTRSGNENSLDSASAIDNLVMYEVNLRALSASGDFQGVVSKLDHIKSLGVNVIWLMPIHPIGKIKTVNSPYCVQNYLQVNPEFGSFTEFKYLVQQAHARGMSVILDWVANHTAWDNPWIEHKDWYSQNSDGEIIIPPGTDWQDVADLNYDNMQMRQAMIAAMKYWVVNADIDGFRCDAADYVPFDFWKQAIDTLENIENKNLIYLAEGSRKDHFSAGFQMNYGWDFYNSLKDVIMDGLSADYLWATQTSEYNTIPEGKEKLRFITNHDESAWDATPVVLFNGNDGSLAAFVIVACLDGVPLIYGSQEVGVVDNVSFFNSDPIDWNQNPGLLAGYRQLMSVYNNLESLRKGTISSYKHTDILTFKKRFENNEALVMVNTRKRVITYNLPQAFYNSSWTDAFDSSAVSLDSLVQFQPFEYFILTRNISG